MTTLPKMEELVEIPPHLAKPIEKGLKQAYERGKKEILTELEGKVKGMEKPQVGFDTMRQCQIDGYNEALSDVSSLISELRKCH